MLLVGSVMIIGNFVNNSIGRNYYVHVIRVMPISIKSTAGLLHAK